MYAYVDRDPGLLHLRDLAERVAREHPVEAREAALVELVVDRLDRSCRSRRTAPLLIAGLTYFAPKSAWKPE